MSSGGNDKWRFYTDAKGHWRWRRTAADGCTVDSSAEGYEKESDCIDNAKQHGFMG